MHAIYSNGSGILADTKRRIQSGGSWAQTLHKSLLAPSLAQRFGFWPEFLNFRRNSSISFGPSISITRPKNSAIFYFLAQSSRSSPRVVPASIKTDASPTLVLICGSPLLCVAQRRLPATQAEAGGVGAPPLILLLAHPTPPPCFPSSHLLTRSTSSVRVNLVI